jgi:hypothetical protein
MKCEHKSQVQGTAPIDALYHLIKETYWKQ